MTSSAISKISFYNEAKSGFRLLHQKKLKAYISLIFRGEGIKFTSLKYVFCTDEYLKKINKQFLKHNYYTDIISFNLSGDPRLVDGEIYISIERVKANARTFNQSFKSEIHRVIFHGALHLCGYDDKSNRELMKMRQKEDHHLNTYFQKIKNLRMFHVKLRHKCSM